ncbi:hypothetical protein [Aeromonas sobria]|uniref:hypothetical protein n=1 Tax=Aeromonas sobria TaxID=646 RepID=UPI000C6EA9D8|nr:hypothetical protein [Aeromonas sobria]PKQ78105.1 hypothetical protein CJF47_07435 [Aeromonas sobria]
MIQNVNPTPAIVAFIAANYSGKWDIDAWDENGTIEALASRTDVEATLLGAKSYHIVVKDDGNSVVVTADQTLCEYLDSIKAYFNTDMFPIYEAWIECGKPNRNDPLWEFTSSLFGGDD